MRRLLIPSHRDILYTYQTNKQTNKTILFGVYPLIFSNTMTTDFFASRGFSYNAEGENGLMECYIKRGDASIEYYSRNEDNDGCYDYVVMNNDYDVLHSETIAL
jgi:hypothetical protein